MKIVYLLLKYLAHCFGRTIFLYLHLKLPLKVCSSKKYWVVFFLQLSSYSLGILRISSDIAWPVRAGGGGLSRECVLRISSDGHVKEPYEMSLALGARP